MFTPSIPPDTITELELQMTSVIHILRLSNSRVLFDPLFGHPVRYVDGRIALPQGLAELKIRPMRYHELLDHGTILVFKILRRYMNVISFRFG